MLILAQVKYSEKSHSISPARAINRFPESKEQHDECKTTLGDGKDDKVNLTTEEIENNRSLLEDVRKNIEDKKKVTLNGSINWLQ